MDHDSPVEGRSSRRDRLMGKLFGKERLEQKERERKYLQEQSANDISAFLGAGDKLEIIHPPPPPPPQGHRDFVREPPSLTLDTTRSSRFPDALDVDGIPQQYRARSHSPPRHKKNKGLVVRFVDSYPEIIGEGGDECPDMVLEIGRRKRSKSAPVAPPIPPTKAGHEYARNIGAFQEVHKVDDGFVPGPIRRTQTGFSSIGEFEKPRDAPKPPNPPPPQPRTVGAGDAAGFRFLELSDKNNEKRKSFLEIQQHEQREAEGMAFAKAIRRASAHGQADWENQDPSSSPEEVRTSPRRMQIPRKELPQTVVQGPASPYRTQSQRAPPSPTRNNQIPMRSKSERVPVPQVLPPPISPREPIPPRNPARRSPYRPSPVETADQTTDANPPLRSPLPPATRSNEPSSFSSVPSRSQRPMSPDELRLNTGGSSNNNSPQRKAGTTFSTADLSHQAPPITQNPRERALSALDSAPQSPHDVAATPIDEAYNEFIHRTKHLYELFRLHAEQYKPLGTSQPEDMCRAALWWFLKGRMALETALRNRTADSEEQKALMARYQAYTDLTKAYWLMEMALPEIAEGKYSPVEGGLGETRQILTSQLKKLAGSMKRNGFLPPQDPFMPQMMDKSIWIEYPSLSHDIVQLLNGNWGSLLAAPTQTPQSLSPLEALPLSDTKHAFNYGRVPADVYLMEQGMGDAQTYFSCMLSICRPVNDAGLHFIVASQNGCVSMRIQSDKNAGPCWENVRWRSESCSLELKMPRGFLMAIQCTQQDFRMLWNIFDFASRVQSYLYPQKDEEITFQAQLRGFHYFDADPNARTFPKDPVGQCELGIYERILKQDSPTGLRSFHRGFRLAVVTGPQTRTLSGVTHFYTPQMPIQFAYLRGEQREPMLQLSYTGEQDRCRMVLSFNDEGERDKVINLLKGTYIHHDEDVFGEVALQGLSMSENLVDTEGSYEVLQRMPWQLVRVINDKYAGETPPTVLAEKLRLEINSLDSKGLPVGTIVDRINMAPGEFKIRLGTKDILQLQVLRSPQVDMTVSVLDRPGLADAPRDFAAFQAAIGQSQTVRTYQFSSFVDLHAFQAAITGFTVLYDGIVSSVNISRRRMVVPVYKKWESGTARLLTVQQDKTIQLLAFFENWHHGQCMAMVLKSTDVFESFGKGNKSGLKIVDAKFPLPQTSREKEKEEGEERQKERGGKGDEPATAFVCLDMLAYPTEHDDITIMFEDEGERGKLCATLPAPVRGSRLSKIKMSS